MAKSERKSKSKESNGCLALALTEVLIPSVGRVNLHQGHLSFMKGMTGSSAANFSSIMELRKLVVKARATMLKGRQGSEGQSLAFFMRMEDVANGVVLVEDATYAKMAGVWDKYCNSRYKEADGTMKPYGKKISSTIFIGLPKLGKGWRQAHTSFPLHTVPCDVCLFLASVVRKDRPSENPYASLDLKSIHEFYAAKLATVNLLTAEEESEPGVEEPDYQPVSPVISDDEESAETSDDEPVPEVRQQVVVDIPQEENHRIGKRKREKGVVVPTTSAPKQLFPTKKEGTIVSGKKVQVQTFVPGEFEW